MLKTMKVADVSEGSAVKMKRLLPSRKQRSANPFLRIDHFNIREGGFPNQVHHGFEGLFYLFSGSIHHEDSMANYFDIDAGGAEIFTAGAGLLHSEMAESDARGIRVWIDLPDDKKHMKPKYQRFEVTSFPETSNNSVSVRTIVGKGSPLCPQANVEVFDITLSEKSVYKYMIPENFNGFLYVVVGSVKVQGKVIGASETIYFESERSIAMLSTEGARVFLCFGEPNKNDMPQVQSYDTV